MHEVDVVIPAYNAERTVAAAVASALSQFPVVRRVVWVDDGSTNRTAGAAAMPTTYL
ncbi:MAG: hypothetical protein JWO31_3595 [Phycisphaerales bacterium]|nr:hypothetical protein [Phycisphaerales bacterium]